MPRHSLFIYGGAIGDTLLGIQLAHALQAAGGKSTLTLISTRASGFSRQVAEAAGVRYLELPREKLFSWFALVRFAFSPHAVVYLEPFQDKIPTWWKIIARMATLTPGSIEVHCQSRPQAVTGRVRVISYSPQKDNLFSMIAQVPAAWGAAKIASPVPWLPRPQCSETPKRPYILFHFFAGAYRRSFPIEKVRPLLMEARKEFPGHEFVLTCAHGEEATAARMTEGVSDARIEISPSAKKLFCLLMQSSVCVGVASGVTHIAAHLKAPAVILCNLSDPCWLPSYNPEVAMLSERANCKCNGDKTGDCGVETPGGLVYHCLYDISTERIIAAMKQKISQPS